MNPKIKKQNEKSSVFTQFFALFSWGRIVSILKNLDRDGAIDSARNILMVLGLGTLIGDFATMKAWYTVPALAILTVVWYADYLRHDFTPPAATIEGGAIIGPSLPRVTREWSPAHSCFRTDRSY